MKKLLILVIVTLGVIVFMAQPVETTEYRWRIKANSCQAFHMNEHTIGTHHSCTVCDILGIEQGVYGHCAVPNGGDHGYYNSSGKILKITEDLFLCVEDECYELNEAIRMEIITEF